MEAHRRLCRDRFNPLHLVRAGCLPNTMSRRCRPLASVSVSVSILHQGSDDGDIRPASRQRRVAGHIAAGLLIAVFLLGCSGAADRADSFFENRAVYRAVVHYLDAEVRRDHKAIYRSLAPSSPYCMRNTFEMYLAEAENAPAIASYRIVRISDTAAMRIAGATRRSTRSPGSRWS